MGNLKKIRKIRNLHRIKDLSKKLGQEEEKPILEETTLTDDDRVYLNRKFNTLFLAQNGHVYLIEGWFSKIDPSNPKVSLEYIDEENNTIKDFMERFQPYKELKKSQ